MKTFVMRAVIRNGIEIVADLEEKFNSRADAQKCMFNVEDNLEKDERITYRKIYELLSCACGRAVRLTDFTNTCRCGSDYNMSGQKLAPREQWGEETGEHWSECY